MKHNKKRNTAFIYETLSRELARALVEKSADRGRKTTEIIKEFFKRNSILAEELQLYSALLDTRNITGALAERLLKETKLAYSSLDEKTIFDTQSKLIAAINKGLGTEVWSTFVPNFKSLASINAIFNKKTAVKQRVLFEQFIVEDMSAKKSTPSRPPLEPLDNLEYNSFIKKFNTKYGFLLQEQKCLLNQFITSFADNGFELRVYLNEELQRLKTQVNNIIAAGPEERISQRLTEVAQYLEEFKKRDFTDVDLNKILKNTGASPGAWFK